MLDSIKNFFQDKMAVPEDLTEDTADGAQHPALQVAACALLLEIAYADDEFADTERAHLENAIQRHFGLDDETARELIEFADRERRHNVDLYQFTRLISKDYNHAQKMVLLETMWGLVYADGVVAEHETHLMRKLSHLLDVKPAFLSEAKKKADRRHD
ncbi:MAG: TerB family tellurite resistance protein [Gemmatimonadetes bacterium]|nr:TerB family tellurite resistance protein [Gemmatimonadota bacterium]